MIGAPMLVNGPKTIARIRAEGREPFAVTEEPAYDNDNRPRVVTNAPGSSFKRFVPKQFEIAEYLIKGILPLHGVAVLGGQYSAGKTFLAMDIGMHLIHGAEFLGRKTKPGAVLWIAAEGAGIVEQRMEAARLAKFEASIDATHFPFLWREPKLERDTDAILASLGTMIREAKNECEEHHPDRPLRLVVVDTLPAYFLLENENDNAEVATFVAKLGKIARDMNVLIVPIHHVGKNADGGLRGASALGAGADAVLVALADIHPTTGQVTGPRTLSLAKTRGGVPGSLTTFTIDEVVIGVDRDADDIPVGYVQYVPLEANSKDKSRPLPQGLQVAIAAINEALNKHGEEVRVFEDAPPRKVVRIDHVRDEFLRGYVTGDSSTTHASKVKAFSRNLTKVLEGRKYASRTVAEVEYLWVV